MKPLLSYEAEADHALKQFRLDAAASRRVLEGDILEPARRIEAAFQADPFSRAVHIALPEGASISEAVEAGLARSRVKIGPRLMSRVRAYLNDQPVPRDQWDKIRPKRSDVLFLRVEMAGGGGKKKNPLRAILTIALVVVAFWAGSAVAGLSIFGKTGALAGWGGIAGNIATGAVLIAGQALINAVIPPPKLSSKYAFDQQPGNPYAQITGLNNRPGNWAPIPRIVGTRRLYPMLAAKPYTESQGSTQYLRMLLLVGYGPLDISDIRIGNTPISAFAGAEVEIREGWDDDDPVTLYTRTIEEEALSIELEPSVANTRTTEEDAREVSIDIVFPQGLATYDANGNPKNRTVLFTVQYSPTGAGSWTNAVWIDGKSEHGTGTNGQISASASSKDAEVRSGRFNLPAAGEYDVRVTRTTSAGDSQTVDTAYWTVLRSIKQDSPINMDGLALIALRLKATKQLNGAPDTINCLAKSYLPIWDDVGEEWNYTITRNPAWEYVDVLRRRGAKQLIADDRFNLDQIMDWADACDSEPPNAEEEPYHACDLIFEGGSCFTAAQAIAAHGRAQFSLIDGIYGVVRDAEQTVPVMHISPRNSWGYSGSKSFPDIPHAFRVQWINPNKDYAVDEIIVYRDGYDESGSGGNTAATKFEPLEFLGCTSATQAYREARYHFGVLLLRPEEHSVSMDIEALRCTKGDLVRFSHDVISIGLGDGRIAGRTISVGNVTHFVLDAPISMATGTDYALRIRHGDDGSSSVHPIVTEDGSDIDTVELVTPVAEGSAAVAGDLFQFGEADLETAPMIISRIERGEELTARVFMVDAQEGVWTADGGAIPAFNSYITTPVAPAQKQPATPAFQLRSDASTVERFSDGTLIERIAVSLTRPGASDVIIDHWEVQWRESDAVDGDWRVIAPIRLDAVTVYLSPVEAGRQYDIRVRTVSIYGRESDWQTSSGYEVTGQNSIPPDVTGFSADPQVEGCELSWNAVSFIDLRGYKIRRGDNWDAGVDVVSNAVGTKAFVALPDFTTFTFWIKAISKTGIESENAASVTATSVLGTLVEPFDIEDLPSYFEWALDEQNTLAELIALQRITLEKLGFADGIPLGTVIIEERNQRQEGDLQIAEVISLIGAKTGDNTAFILDLDTAMVGPSESLAQRFSSLTASIDDAEVSITSLLSVTASLEDGVEELEALASVKFDVNGRVTGYYIKATDTTTDMVFIADVFAIIDPSNGLSSPFVPFVVTSGVVKMHSVEVDTFKANSVTAAAINVSTLSALSATIGLLRTATSGERVEIRDNLIEVYDSSNNLRVEIGVLS